jgi:replicative DNA helicase
MTQIELEQIILGSVILDKDAQIEFFALVQSSNVFTEDKHKIICNALKSLYDQNKPIDLLTIAEWVKKSGHYKNMGGGKTLAQLVTKISSAAHFSIHIRILLEAYLKRGIGTFAQQLLTSSVNDVDDVFERVSKVQTGLENLINQVVIKDEKSISETLGEIREKWQIENVSGLAGIPTGINALDAATGGLVDSDLIVMGARPGQGKTAFVMSLLQSYAKRNIPVGMFSLEMGQTQLVQRLLSLESDVFAYKIRNDKYDHYDRQRLHEASLRIEKWPLFINDEAGMTLRRLKTKAHIWKKEHGIKLLCVDYLQLMSSDTKKFNRESEISEISRGLKILAKDLNIPIIALSQLSRAVESRPDKMPQLSDLRESGAIEQDADSIWFLMRPGYYSQFRDSPTTNVEGKEYATENLCILSIAKFRAGETKLLPLKWDSNLMKFSDYETTTF